MESLTEAIEGTERDLLVARRHYLAATLEAGAPAHAVAGLDRQLGEVDRLIRALDAQEEQEGEGDGPKPDEALDPASL